ncbi:hypothetical protein NDU88_004494 [Pleurodeles waltl]|uniref:Uncharacterized protein n=1 Tax=Pleurodeles waltl TaxID=8319 RepID=A0AAV7QIH3_PLEWA|nr:hypothetical protein NDU88_004494 [Pleurodeles waltl]
MGKARREGTRNHELSTFQTAVRAGVAPDYCLPSRSLLFKDFQHRGQRLDSACRGNFGLSALSVNRPVGVQSYEESAGCSSTDSSRVKEFQVRGESLQ